MKSLVLVLYTLSGEMRNKEYWTKILTIQQIGFNVKVIRLHLKN